MENGNNQEANTPYFVEKTFEEKLQGFGRKLANNISTIAIIIIIIWWVLYGAISISAANIDLEQKIGLTITTYIVASSYYQLIANGGFKSAKETQIYKEANNGWAESVRKGNTKKREIIQYAKDMAIINLMLNRKENLENNELVYDDFFDRDGNLINTTYKKNKYHKKNNPTGYTKKQMKIIEKSIKTKINIPTIFGSLSSKYFGVKKEITESQYNRTKTALSSVIRLVLSFVSVGIAFKWIGFTPETVMYALLQITLWTASGVVQRIKNYNFVIDVLTPQMVEKKLIIDGFLSLSQEEQDKYSKRVEEESKGILQIEYKKGEN